MTTDNRPNDKYTPTTEDIRASYREAIHKFYQIDEEFDRWLVEVERAAAEKAWNRCVGEMPIDLDWKNYYGDNNPYRREET